LEGFTLSFAVCATIPATICSGLPLQEKSRRSHQAEFVTPMGQGNLKASLANPETQPETHGIKSNRAFHLAARSLARLF
jgi:hypothetical protein